VNVNLVVQKVERQTLHFDENASRVLPESISQDPPPAGLLISCLSMVFSENRFPLFRIML